MKILLVNNFSHLRGGAEVSFFNTKRLLKKKKHQVSCFFADKELDFKINKMAKAFNLLYSLEARRKIGRVLDRIKPDIVHLNNIYHHLSPSIVDEIKKRKIPMVMTLRDYKLVCALYKLWRKEKICQDCKNRNFINILKNKCQLKGNFGESFLLWLEMNLHHKILHIYEKVDIFISPSKFLIKKFKEMGFKKKIIYLPNFIFFDDYQPDYKSEEKSIVYFGRLAPEKGLFSLIKAVKNLPLTLKIIGKGEMKAQLKKKVLKDKIKNVKFLGWLEGKKLENEIKKSLFTVLPSVWYENSPRSILESFALGRPVIASKIGGIPELVKDGLNGLLVKPGQAKDLRKKIIWLVANYQVRVKMAKTENKLARERYNEERYYKKLMEIYKKILS